MIRCRARARALYRLHVMAVAVWMAFTLISPNDANSDTRNVHAPNAFHKTIASQIHHEIQCTELRTDSSFCSLRTELQYHHYLKTPMTSHERLSSGPSDDNQPRADFLAVFRLAMEEFDILSGMRIYWEYTERNIEQWAVKLRLKGEITITDTSYFEEGQSVIESKASRSRLSSKANKPVSLLSLFAPEKIKWNLGLNPEDMALSGDFRINRYMSVYGELGDESQVGIYFRFAF